MICDCFGNSGERFTINEINLFSYFTVLALPFPVNRYCENCNSRPPWGIRQFRVAGKMTHQQHLIKTTHTIPSFLKKKQQRNKISCHYTLFTTPCQEKIIYF